MTAQREDPRLRADRLQLEHDDGTHPGGPTEHCPACWAEASTGGHEFRPGAGRIPTACSCGWTDNAPALGSPFNPPDRAERRRAWFGHVLQRRR